MSIDPSDEHHKLVFAHAGAALYHAQVFEEALTCFILAVSMVKKEVSSAAALDELDRTLREKTLGGLIKQARKHLKISTAAEKQIDEALEQRNQLTHHFFKDQAECFFSVPGRNRMIAKLESYQSSFIAASDVVGSLAKKLLKERGVTDEMIEQRMAEMKQKA